jgi:hypothetical protein
MRRRADIFAAIERSGTRRGGLREWMRKNHDAFAERLRTLRPNWDLLAEVFARAELTDQRGNLPSKGETVRKTWQRVRQEMRERPQPVVASTPRATSSDHPAIPVARPQPAERADVALGTADPARNQSMDDVLAEWDARQPKIPEPLTE